METGYFTEENSAEVVAGRIADTTDPRFKEIMTVLIRHLHAAVKEIEPTQEEWFQAIQFLTATGHMCDDWRQEFILLSDVLGVSMLVDAIAIKHLIPVLDEFQHQFPKVQVDLIISDQKLDLIAEQIDLAIRIGLPNDDSLIGRVMYEERSALYASPAYLEKYGTPKVLDDLAKHKWVAISQMSQAGEQSLFYQDKPVHIRPASYQLTNSPLVAQSLTLAGHGIGVLLPVTVKNECEAGLLIPIELGVSSFGAVFTLVYPSRRQVPARVRVLIDYLLEVRMFG